MLIVFTIALRLARISQTHQHRFCVLSDICDTFAAAVSAPKAIRTFGTVFDENDRYYLSMSPGDKQTGMIARCIKKGQFSPNYKTNLTNRAILIIHENGQLKAGKIRLI